MNKYVPIAALATAALFATAPAALNAETVAAGGAGAAHAQAATVKVTAGKALYGANGSRIATIYRVAADGRAQIILDGKLINVPAATLSEVNGKVTTSLTKLELERSAG